MDTQILTFPEVSKFLKIPKSTLYKLCQKKEIPYFKIGKQLRFRKTSLEQWIYEKEKPVSSEPKHILVIDDDPLVLKSLANFLRRSGYRVEEVQSAQEALEKIEGLKFDLLVTDVKMPGIDGIEAIKRIRKFNFDYQRPQIPEIVISGFIDTQAEENAERLGIDHYLYKPFAIGDLMKAIDRKLKPDGAE